MLTLEKRSTRIPARTYTYIGQNRYNMQYLETSVALVLSLMQLSWSLSLLSLLR